MDIDAHRELRYKELIAVWYDLSNAYTTQEGDVFGMEGAKCPRGHESMLSHRTFPSGFFNCPACGIMYDEPYFDPDEFISNVDDHDTCEDNGCELAV